MSIMFEISFFVMTYSRHRRNLDMVRQQLAKDHPARRSLENLLHALASPSKVHAALDPRVQGNRLGLQGMFDLTDVGECHPLTNVAVAH